MKNWRVQNYREDKAAAASASSRRSYRILGKLTRRDSCMRISG